MYIIFLKDVQLNLKDMNHVKEVQVLMLATEGARDVLDNKLILTYKTDLSTPYIVGYPIYEKGEVLFYAPHKSGGSLTSPLERNFGGRWKAQHLYLVDNSPIEVGDWFMDTLSRAKKVLSTKNKYITKPKYFLKILASTESNNICKLCQGEAFGSLAYINIHNIRAKADEVEFDDKPLKCLKCSKCGHSWINNYPTIPEPFIKEYVKQGGIDKVKVLYKDTTFKSLRLDDKGQAMIRKEVDVESVVQLKCYTQTELELNMQYYMEYCINNRYITPKDWIENHKHF